MDINTTTLVNMTGAGPGATRQMAMPRALGDYLKVYHSDYRWIVKYYYSKNPYKTNYFKGAIASFLNYKGTGDNYVIYGAPMHEYFYGKFNSEWFHQFCDKEIL